MSYSRDSSAATTHRRTRKGVSMFLIGQNCLCIWIFLTTAPLVALYFQYGTIIQVNDNQLLSTAVPLEHMLFGRPTAGLNRTVSVPDAGKSTTEPTWSTTTQLPPQSSTEYPPHPHAGALFPNGTRGYVADPTALKRGMAAFLRQKHSELFSNDESLEQVLQAHPHLYWDLLQHYESQYRCGNPQNYWKTLEPYPGRYNCSTYSGFEVLSSEHVCAGGPGRGLEGEGGYKLLVEKIKVYNVVDAPSASNTSPRILCAMYTYHRMRDLARSQAISWGHKCDGFLAFSTETIPSLGMVELLHQGEESYYNMWQKTRSIWSYLHDHYLDQYDFFHLGGDDLYVVVENLRRFLARVQQTTRRRWPVYLGQWIPLRRPAYFVGGGPGYTLNRVALTRLVRDVLPVCEVNTTVSHEDRTLSHCLRKVRIEGGDTRDIATGEQTYHDCGPDHLYTFRSTTNARSGSFHAKAASYWETLPHPNPDMHHANSSRPIPVGPKHGLEAAATFSVSLHDFFHPLYTARIHSILYKRTCPSHSPLGRALGAHSDDST